MSEKIVDYQATLKKMELEEPVDRLLHRPLAHLIVKAVFKTPLTPHHLSLMSIVTGILAGVCFSKPGYAGPAWGALFIVFSNIFDCADGQLARMRGAGSASGILWEYIADSLRGSSVFFGLAFRNPADFYFLLGCGASLATQLLIRNYYLDDYLYFLEGKKEPLMDKILKEAARANLSFLDKVVLKPYLFFYKKFYRPKPDLTPSNTSLEKTMTPKGLVRYRHLQYAWSWLGGGTQLSCIALGAFLGRPELGFKVLIIFFNPLLILLLALQFLLIKPFRGLTDSFLK